MIKLMTFFLLTSASSFATAKDVRSLTLVGPDGATQTLTPQDLAKRLPAKELVVDANPAYGGARKLYRGYDFFELLGLMKVDARATAIAVEVTTQDGWKAPAYDTESLSRGHALLAISESKATLTKPISTDGLWSMVVTAKKTLYPGPYYLVWNDRGKNPDVMPLQVVKIRAVGRVN